MKGGEIMASLRGIIARATGTARNTQFRKSARVSARAFSSNKPTSRMRTVARRKSLGGKGG